MIAEASQDRGHKGASSRLVNGNGKSNVRGASEEFADLLERRELRFVHLDDHPSLIDLKTLPQPRIPLEELLLDFTESRITLECKDMKARPAILLSFTLILFSNLTI